ncbi:MAG: multi-sensor hybrid histidine kinase [Bryobacterales bacterium]|nr:multi-sensor hybrid histidine kinase [Bryobacterales bacterium]
MPYTLGSRPTILVVDDEPALVELVKFILEEAGYSVLSACDGKQAIDLCMHYEYSIDLLLTDINMPRMSGVELASRFSDLLPHVPVIFMTGYRTNNPGVEILVREGPFSECKIIRKPFTAPELLCGLTSVFQER